MEPAIQFDQVAVRYRLPRERIRSIKEYAIRRLKRSLVYDDFWALTDINLTVQSGEVLGIIGRNGAGKSTLLKVVARVLRPTRGRICIAGRVSPLLELGAGFNYELTGRENTYLYGTILGFSRKDIDSRFEQIMDFSGLGDFIDSPLRTYSSGMVARLGFSIATDQAPEILIIDEILSVGDAEFQKRSRARIDSFRGSETTILLVSHSLDEILKMCDRVAWLDHGRLVAQGAPADIVQQYQNTISQI
jgi:ABC-2 type transport system ATP-binding protein/lipopolysaccharide transport system ATP-binding protein